MYHAYPADLLAQPVVQRRRHAPRSSKSMHVSPVPNHDPYSGLSRLPKMLAWHSANETGSFDPYRGENEQTVSVHVPPMFGTTVSHIFGISTFVGNLASSVQASDSRNISSALPDWHPCPGLGPDSRDPILNVLVEQNSSVSFPS